MKNIKKYVKNAKKLAKEFIKERSVKETLYIDPRTGCVSVFNPREKHNC